MGWIWGPRRSPCSGIGTSGERRSPVKIDACRNRPGGLLLLAKLAHSCLRSILIYKEDG